MRLLLACWLVSLALSSTATAQEDEWGFDDEETYVSEAASAVRMQNTVQVMTVVQ